jgi:hypothetical protein
MLVIAGSPASWGHAEDARIAKLRASERKSFSDREITDGFFRIAFGAEYAAAGRTNRIRKYEGPVRVFIDNRADNDRRSQVATVVDNIRAHVHHLDIAVTERMDEANVVVALVREQDLAKTIRELFGAVRAKRIQTTLDPQCLSGFAKGDDYRIQQSSVILVADAGDFVFYDCAYEELLQALGPINDDDNLPWSMFNDNVQKGFFDIYDQYIVNILYDPRIRAGMTRAQVRALLPQVLPDVRAFVARINNLPR